MTTPALPIIGQQAIVFYKHAQTLGIVTAYKDDFPHQWIRVRVPNGVELQFSPGNVELINPRGPTATAFDQPLKMLVSREEMRERIRTDPDLPTEASAGERGNKAGPAFSGSLHAEQPAPSSGSLPNTSGPASAAALVAEQATDPGLWFIPSRASEDYLQAALRELHAAVEGEKP